MLSGSLKEQLEQYVNLVEDQHKACLGNEAQTKLSLIAPLFAILGYNLADHLQCKAEYKADFGDHRSKEPVDWAVFVSNTLAFLVEAKAVGEIIARAHGQLRDYYAQARGAVKLGILTNGVRWHFFTDLAAQNIMDEEPFLEWDVLKGAIPCEFLTILQRAEFKPEEIRNAAKALKNAKDIKDNLAQELDDPSDDLVRAVAARIHKGTKAKLTKEKLTDFKRLTRCAFQELIKERVNQQLGIAKVSTPATTPRTGDIQPSSECGYIEFWEPIRSEPNGLFAGKPCGGGWITKTVRGICLSLEVGDHACHVDIEFSDENRQERRDKALELLAGVKCPHDLRELQKTVSVRFRVLDKGIDDRDNWPEIRQKLTQLGEEIYDKLKNSDV